MASMDSMERRPYLIAEIGANHCGRADLAAYLAQVCIDAGVDAVKGQIRDVYGSPCLYGELEPYDGPHSYGRTYLAHRQALELHYQVHLALREQCESQGVDYSVSVWDAPSAEAWLQTAPKWVKVPSACLTREDVLQPLREWDGTVILSTGLHTTTEAHEVIASFDPARLAVLHCTGAYPCRPEDVHLAEMVALARSVDCPVGVSGHWTGASAIDVQAATLGAAIIERHVTLDRSAKGTDHAASLEPDGIRRWVRDCRQVSVAYGRAGLRESSVYPCEESARRKLMGGE